MYLDAHRYKMCVLSLKMPSIMLSTLFSCPSSEILTQTSDSDKISITVFAEVKQTLRAY